MTTQQSEAAALSATVDEVDGLLSEFDKAAPAAADPLNAPAQQQPAVEIPESFTARLLRKLAERDARMRDAIRPKEPEPEAQQTNDRLAQLEEFAAGIEAEHAQQLERAEAQKVFDQAAQIAEEVAPWLPPDMAKAWLLNEVATDGNLQQAWEERHNSPEHALISERRIAKALQKFRTYAKSLPDPKASEDRLMVTAAIRGASGKPPPDRPPNYSAMSDVEFDREMRAKYGINTRLA